MSEEVGAMMIVVAKLYLLVAVGVFAYLYRTQVCGVRDTLMWLSLLLAALFTAAMWPAWVVVGGLKLVKG